MKTVLVTGASKGIGKAIAEKFHNEGYAVIGTYNKTEPSGNIDFFKCNLSDEKQLFSLISYVKEKYKSLDVLVNNAGISQVGLIQDSFSEYEKLSAVNLKAVCVLSGLAAEIMVSKKSGSIVNISSVWGERGASCESLYSALKGGVNSFTKALAQELGPSGITVNAVAPGVIKTDMLNVYSEEDLEELKSRTPLMRLGTPEDIADAVFFISNAKFITGNILTVDGGFSL